MPGRQRPEKLRLVASFGAGARVALSAAAAWRNMESMRNRPGGLSMTWRAVFLVSALLLASPAAPALAAAAVDGAGATGLGAAQGPHGGEVRQGGLDLQDLKRRLIEKNLGFGSAI